MYLGYPCKKCYALGLNAFLSASLTMQKDTGRLCKGQETALCRSAQEAKQQHMAADKIERDL
jgi:hypothetical protein